MTNPKFVPNPNTSNTYKGREVKWNGRYYNANSDSSLNKLQRMHMNGDLNLHEPVEAYYVEWYHDRKGDNHYPLPKTKVKRNLPCIAQQWKEDIQRRSRNG